MPRQKRLKTRMVLRADHPDLKLIQNDLLLDLRLLIRVYVMSIDVLILHRPSSGLRLPSPVFRRKHSKHINVEREPESPEYEADSPAATAPRTILLVDDAQEARFIMKVF